VWPLPWGQLVQASRAGTRQLQFFYVISNCCIQEQSNRPRSWNHSAHGVKVWHKSRSFPERKGTQILVKSKISSGVTRGGEWGGWRTRVTPSRGVTPEWDLIFCGRIDKECWTKTLEGGEGEVVTTRQLKEVITFYLSRGRWLKRSLVFWEKK